MATLRELKGRIGSVASSEKITGAMKMISSAKMRKAEQALRRLQPYRSQIEHIIGNLLTADAEFESPLIHSREVRHITIVVFGSDDGLCGAYNVNIFKVLLAQLGAYRTSFPALSHITVIPVGTKIAKAVNKIADDTISVKLIQGVDSKTTGDGVKVFMESLTRDFLSGVTDKVDIMYMNFQSMSRQRPVTDQLLPVSGISFVEAGAAAQCRPYIFEPDASTVFNAILPMFLMSVMQDVFTENRASEQAARVMAMQSANDNAIKLLDQLRLEFNKLRQQSITTELLDILGGQIR